MGPINCFKGMKLLSRWNARLQSYSLHCSFALRLCPHTDKIRAIKNVVSESTYDRVQSLGDCKLTWSPWHELVSEWHWVRCDPPTPGAEVKPCWKCWLLNWHHLLEMGKTGAWALCPAEMGFKTTSVNIYQIAHFLHALQIARGSSLLILRAILLTLKNTEGGISELLERFLYIFLYLIVF